MFFLIANELKLIVFIFRMIKHFKKQRRLVPERTIWKYFVQLCSALEHMHKKRVMHRGTNSKV